MKVLKYIVFAVLFIEALANFFPLIFRPIYDLGFGIITFGRFLGLVMLALVLWLLVRKEETV